MTDDDIVADVIGHHPTEPTEQSGATGVLVLQESCLRLRDDEAPSVSLVAEVGRGWAPTQARVFTHPAALALWRVRGKHSETEGSHQKSFVCIFLAFICH